MTIEVIITIVVVAIAAFILYTNLRKKSLGDCGCGDCGKSKRKVRSK